MFRLSSVTSVGCFNHLNTKNLKQGPTRITGSPKKRWREMALEIRCKSWVWWNNFSAAWRVAAMMESQFNWEETKQHDVVMLSFWCMWAANSQQAMTALSTYLWHSAQPRDCCCAWRQNCTVRCIGEHCNLPPCIPHIKLSTSMRFRKKVGIIHWHKSFTDLFPWAASVKWNTKVATIKYLRNR